VSEAEWDDHERALAQAGADGLVVWTSAAWSDRCYTWCLLDTLERIGVPRAKVIVSQPEAEVDWLSMGATAPERLRAGFDAAAPLDDAFADESIALWRKFASPSPLAFDEARRRGSRSFPELGRIAEGHAAWFPWREADGRLRLSDVDDTLFHWIDEDWRSAVDLLKTPEARRTVQRVMGWVGDSSVFARLAAWSDAGAVELRGSWEHGRANDYAVRLTPAGKQLHDQGAATVAQLAPVAIGGCRINDAKTPWLRVADADGWKLIAG
jgi:hypothetical protein